MLKMKPVQCLLVLCLLAAETWLVSAKVSATSVKIKCVRKRDIQHLPFHERWKRCSGGGFGGGFGGAFGGGPIERITVVGRRPVSWGNVITDPGAIRNFLGGLRGSAVNPNEGGGGAGPSEQSDKNCFGDVDKVDSSGASAATAKQDGLKTTGETASNQLAKTDSNRINQYKDKINQVSKETGMDAAIIAAIISRESRGGAALRSDGYGRSDPNGFGLMQVDKNSHTPQGGYNSVEHLRQGVSILKGQIQGVRDCHPSWTNNQVLKGGISAYNAGVKNVRNYGRMDVGTTGNDYANDVIARAKYLKKNGFKDPKDQKCSGGSGKRKRRATCRQPWFNPNEKTPTTGNTGGQAGNTGGQAGNTGGRPVIPPSRRGGSRRNNYKQHLQ